MKVESYAKVVSDLKISDLRAFLDAQKSVPEDWKDIPAPKKRERFMQILKDSEALRADFVEHVQKHHDGEAPNFAHWEEKGQTSLGQIAQEIEAEMTAEQEDESKEPDSAEAASHAHQSEQAQKPDAESEYVPPQGEATSALPSVAGAANAVIVEGYFDQVASDVAGLAPEDALSALNLIEESKEEAYIRMGALISHMKGTQAYAALGYENLRAMISDRTHLEYRTAMYLATNYEKVVELGIPSDKLAGIGWTKLRDVLPYMTPDNYEGWLDKARNLQKAALYNAIAEEKKLIAPEAKAPAGEAKPTVETKTKGFAVTEDQSALVDQALAKAKIEADTDANGPALAAMAAAYLGQPVAKQTSSPDTSEDSIKALAKALKDEEKTDGEGLIKLLNAIEEFWSDWTITAVSSDDDE